jgi:survival-of-motor-neuron-related-splicing factor 30
MSIEEYEAQLDDVEALLEDSPQDESFLKLKDDLLELIALTKQETEGSGGPSSLSSSQIATSAQDHNHNTVKDQSNTETEPASAAPTPALLKLDKKTEKKLKKPFEIPENLLPLESDTEAQRNKKKRAVKKLKSQYRAVKKDYESTKKQSAWLDFSKKKRKKGEGDSIFKTDDDGGKVGVVTASASTSVSVPDPASSKRQRHTF